MAWSNREKRREGERSARENRAGTARRAAAGRDEQRREAGGRAGEEMELDATELAQEAARHGRDQARADASTGPPWGSSRTRPHGTRERAGRRGMDEGEAGASLAATASKAQSARVRAAGGRSSSGSANREPRGRGRSWRESSMVRRRTERAGRAELRAKPQGAAMESRARRAGGAGTARPWLDRSSAGSFCRAQTPGRRNLQAEETREGERNKQGATRNSAGARRR
jgi:hypothetical protein